MDDIPEFRKGQLAYLDSFAGLVPCKILADYRITCVVKVTANRKGYHKGEIVEFTKHWIVARDKVHIKNGQYVIRS